MSPGEGTSGLQPEVLEFLGNTFICSALQPGIRGQAPGSPLWQPAAGSRCLSLLWLLWCWSRCGAAQCARSFSRLVLARPVQLSAARLRNLVTHCCNVGRNVGGAAWGGSVSLGGGGLVKAGPGRFGNLALVSDGPPVVCVSRLTEWRLSRCCSHFLLICFFFLQEVWELRAGAVWGFGSPSRVCAL